MVRIATGPPLNVSALVSPARGLPRMPAMNTRPDHPTARSRNLVIQFSGDLRRSRTAPGCPGALGFLHIALASEAHAVAFGQVVLIQLAAAVDSLWVVP